MQRLSRWPSTLAVLTVAGLLCGCVTEETGRRFEPAPPAERLEAHLAVARGYLRNGDTQRARAPLERAAAIDPGNWEVLMLSGMLYEAEGETALAESFYKRATRAGGNRARAENNFGVFLVRQGRTKEAIRAFEKAVADPDYEGRPQAFLNLGLAQRAAGDDDAAFDSFERAVRLDDTLARAHLELAELAFQRGDYQRALRHFAGFRTHARQTPRSLLLGIRIARAVRDPDSEASYALQLKNLYPDSAEFREYRERLM